MPFPLIPLITAGVSGLFGLGSKAVSNNANKELAEYQYSKDLEMWNRQNAYNTPSAQMQRFQDAGLNKNLIYGQGSPGNAQQLPKYQAPTVDYETDLGVGKLPEYINQFQDVRNKKATEDNIKANTELSKQRAQNDAIKNAILAIDSKRKGIDLKKAEGLLPYQLQIGKSTADLQTEKLSTQKATTKNIEAETVFKKYRNELNRLGIHTSDNVLFRLLLQNKEALFNFFKNPPLSRKKDLLDTWK